MSIAPTDNQIVRIVQDQALQYARSEVMVKCKEIADEMRGIIISDDVGAARSVDQLKAVKNGQKHAKALLDGLIEPYQRAIQAARDVFAPLQTALLQAEVDGKTSQSTWLRKKEAEAQAERDRLAAAAAEAQRKQREEAAKATAAGKPPPPQPPPMEAPPVVADRGVRGRSGQSYTVSILCCEMLDPVATAAAMPKLLELDEVAAKAWFRGISAGSNLVNDPNVVAHPLGGFVVHGIRFWRDERVGIK